jgi:preprotein translocase subunit SecD
LAKQIDALPAETLASIFQQIQSDPAAAAAAPEFAPFKDLTGDQVALLSAKSQFYAPTITCKQLAARPLGSIDAIDKEVVACGQGQKYLLAAAKVVGTDVKTASAGISQKGVGWEVNIKFTGSGQDKWTTVTTATVGKQLAVVLDRDVVSAPTINEAIPGDATVSGSFTQKQAQTLASQLRYGALPLTFDIPEAQTISATLGTDQLRAGIIAGAIGLGLVVLYAMFYYRLTGIVILFSLVLSAGIVYALMVLLGRQIGFTLTLAGVAGFIVSLGIAADSFVIYFERLKDEIREGRSPRSAVPRAWVRARRTIISANVVSFLAAAVLYLLAVGAVKGFAFTLGLSTLVDLMIVFLFRHPIMSALARTKLFLSPRVSGLGRVTRHDEPERPQRPRRTREA